MVVRDFGEGSEDLIKRLEKLRDTALNRVDENDRWEKIYKHLDMTIYKINYELHKIGEESL